MHKNQTILSVIRIMEFIRSLERKLECNKNSTVFVKLATVKVKLEVPFAGKMQLPNSDVVYLSLNSGNGYLEESLQLSQ